MRRLLLVNDNGDGKVLNGIDMRTTILGKVLLHKRWKRVVKLTSRLGSYGVKHQRTLSRARDTCKNCDLMLGNLERHALEIVLSSSPYYYLIVVHKTIFIFYKQ